VPPSEGSEFDEIFNDTKIKIFPGIKHWNHPKFFAYYPSGSSHATILADMFATAFTAPGFVWHSSPSVTELENIIVDWCVHLFGLP
jgi:glutamate/tyrosine decarboxylase-like PLP-dependent enzyme